MAGGRARVGDDAQVGAAEDPFGCVAVAALDPDAAARAREVLEHFGRYLSDDAEALHHVVAEDRPFTIQSSCVCQVRTRRSRLGGPGLSVDSTSAIAALQEAGEDVQAAGPEQETAVDHEAPYERGNDRPVQTERRYRSLSRPRHTFLCSHVGRISIRRTAQTRSANSTSPGLAHPRSLKISDRGH
jgi:hypothetical protein